MHDNNNIQPEDNAEQSLFPAQGGQDHFSVPAGYFDALPQNISGRIQSGRGTFFLFRPSFAVPSLAFAVLLVVFIGYFLGKHEGQSEDMLLSENDIRNIVDNPELYNVNESAITDLYISSDIPEEEFSEESDLPDDEVRSYLEENSNAQDIINEF